MERLRYDFIHDQLTSRFRKTIVPPVYYKDDLAAGNNSFYALLAGSCVLDVEVRCHGVSVCNFYRGKGNEEALFESISWKRFFSIPKKE